MIANIQIGIFFCSVLPSNAYLFKSRSLIHARNIATTKTTYDSNQLTLFSTASPAVILESFSSTLFNSSFYFNIDKQIANIAVPAFVSLVADPLASMVDALYIGRLDPVNQAGMGISISAHYAISKLYNDPLLKTSTSLVAGKQGEELSASVSTAMLIASIIGIAQTILFFFFGGFIMSLMRVPVTSDMREPALDYLKWRALGVPAATLLLVAIGIFRGRGDTKTPLICSFIGSITNILLDPIFIFYLNMGCAGAGAATAISQWVTAIPMLYLLNRSTRFLDVFTNKVKWVEKSVNLKAAVAMYVNAGGLILLRTIAKVSAYAVTSAYAAGLGSVAMAAYSLTFNLGFATSQLCEAFSVAAQSLLARELPYDTSYKIATTRHIILRSAFLGIAVSGSLAIATSFNMMNVLSAMAKSPQVQAAAAQIMPIVLLTQLFKGLSYASGGILLGGRDWTWSTASMIIASIVCISTVKVLPHNLWNIWVALAAFMATQVLCASARLFSQTGPWKNVSIVPWRNRSRV